MYYSCNLDDTRECLPDIIPCTNFAENNEYFDNLYHSIFIPSFVLSTPMHNGLPVNIRVEPKFGEWEHGFLHCTHSKYDKTGQDLNDRDPDYRRSERITWIRKIIDNYEHFDCSTCDEIYYWEELFSGYVREHFMVFDDNFDSAFLVVLERRKTEYLLITSFYLEKDYQIKRRIQKWEEFQKQKTPLN